MKKILHEQSTLLTIFSFCCIWNYTEFYIFHTEDQEKEESNKSDNSIGNLMFSSNYRCFFLTLCIKNIEQIVISTGSK